MPETKRTSPIVLFGDRLGGGLTKVLAEQDLVPRWNERSTS